MISQPFEYFSPKSLREALKLLDKFKGKAKILAGGQSLVPLMNLGLATPRYIIDINNIRKLSNIVVSENKVTIGSLVRHYEIAESKVVREALLMLSEAAGHIGDIHVRNRGTIGGAVCHADPAGDYAPVLTVADAKFEILSFNRRRLIAARNFFKGVFTTDLKPNEMLAYIHIPRVGRRTGTAYEKLEFVSGGFAVVGAAAIVSLDDRGSVEKLAISVGGVEKRPITIDFTDELSGKKIEASTVGKICAEVKERITEPLSDIHADGEYRRAMSEVFAKRALSKAVKRALGGE